MPITQDLEPVPVRFSLDKLQRAAVKLPIYDIEATIYGGYQQTSIGHAGVGDHGPPNSKLIETCRAEPRSHLLSRAAPCGLAGQGEKVNLHREEIVAGC